MNGAETNDQQLAALADLLQNGFNAVERQVEQQLERYRALVERSAEKFGDLVERQAESAVEMVETLAEHCQALAARVEAIEAELAEMRARSRSLN